MVILGSPLQSVLGAFSRQEIPYIVWKAKGFFLNNALVYNPAGMESVHHLIAGAGYSNLYGVRSLQRTNGYVGFQSKGIHWGAGVGHYGNPAYSEISLNLVGSKRFTSDGIIGVGIHGYQLQIPEYGQARSLGIDLGLLWKVTPGVQWQFAYTNLNQPRLGQSGELLPQQAMTGFQFDPVEKIRAEIFLIQNLRYALRYGVGVGYAPFSWGAVTANMITEPMRGSYGITIHWKSIRAYYLLITHSVLPYTHYIGMVFTL